MDLAEQLLDTWRINNRINLFLLNELSDEQLACSVQKGKAVSEIPMLKALSY